MQVPIVNSASSKFHSGYSHGSTYGKSVDKECVTGNQYFDEARQFSDMLVRQCNQYHAHHPEWNWNYSVFRDNAGGHQIMDFASLQCDVASWMERDEHEALAKGKNAHEESKSSLELRIMLRYLPIEVVDFLVV